MVCIVQLENNDEHREKQYIRAYHFHKNQQVYRKLYVYWLILERDELKKFHQHTLVMTQSTLDPYHSALLLDIRQILHQCVRNYI